MRPLLFILLSFLLILVLIGGAGIGIGFLLHWLIPEIGVEIGSLIGVITFIFSCHFFSRLMSATLTTVPDDVGEGDSDSQTVVLRPIRPRRPATRKK